MSVSIVDALKVVNVHTQYRQRFVAHALAFRDLLFEHHVERPGVGEFCERIDKSAVFRFFKRQSIVEGTGSMLANRLEQANVFRRIGSPALGIKGDGSESTVFAKQR